MSLNNLFGFGGGTDVYVTISPACGMEMIELDKHGNVKSYAQTPIDYNEALREVASYDDFKTSLETLFQMRNINPAKANVHLSLPTVWFGTKEGLPLLLDDNAITNIVIGELEQSFIFKRKEPMPFWFDALASSNSDSRNVFYTAIQAEAVNKIKEILTAMGATLVSVECSLFAALKGLNVTGIAAEQMQNDHSWSLMIINNSGFQMLGMQGKRILEYYEEPLPLKSYEGEEIYSAIENAAQIALMSTPSSSLVVLSETDLVSAEILAGRLQFGGQTLFVEDNEFRKEPLMEMSLNVLSDDQIKVSLHSIGAITPAGMMPVDVNFIAEKGKAKVEVAVINIGSLELTPAKASVLAVILLAVLMTPMGIGWWFTNDMTAKKQNESIELDNQITQLDTQLKEFEKEKGDTSFDAVAEIERVLKNNRTKIMAYAALGESIPKNIYLTYFMTTDDGRINIKGCADSVEDVYVFFKNLKDSLIESKLRLSKLDLKASSLDTVVNSTVSTIDTAPYIFEITNMNDAQLKSFFP
ncbi:MAG: PilN domain-containing protein, partial [Candidatus Gastranaerophilales bacterium]|nr:PilN domain-containing protein [Candidatus Gastranaerophilales bacterium]